MAETPGQTLDCFIITTNNKRAEGKYNAVPRAWQFFIVHMVAIFYDVIYYGLIIIEYIILNMTITYYKLKHASDETKKVYIGSTDNIERRIRSHKSHYNVQKKQLKLYSYIKSNGGWDAWTFEILEQEEIGGDDYKRYEKEAMYIKKYDANLNTIMPVRDLRRQICGSCGEEIDIKKIGKMQLQQHFKLKRCQNATPPIIIRGRNNTINMTIANGRKRPIIIEGDDNTLNIHYPT
jgi:hypothetical protein